MDPIPADAIRLGEAYTLVREAIKGNPKALDTLEDYVRRDLRKIQQFDEKRWAASSKEDKKLFRLEREATAFFRAHLHRGSIIAFIRDPKVGENLQLDPDDWEPIRDPDDWVPISGPWGSQPVVLPPYGLDDFADNDDPNIANPNTALRGKYRPVFLWKKAFEKWLETTFGRKKHPGGRPRGSGSLYPSDQPLLVEMHELIKSKKAKSPTEAAGMVADEARGQSFEAKKTRLRKSYKKMFPLE